MSSGSTKTRFKNSILELPFCCLYVWSVFFFFFSIVYVSPKRVLDVKTMDLKGVVFLVCHWATFLLTPFLTYIYGTFLSQSSKSVKNTKQLGRQHLKQVRKYLDLLFPCTCTTFYPWHFYPRVQASDFAYSQGCAKSQFFIYFGADRESTVGLSGGQSAPVPRGHVKKIVLASLFSQCGSNFFPFNCKNPPKFDRIESLKSPHGHPQ